MYLELTKCALRPWQACDVEALMRHANNRKIWRNVRDRFPHPYTREAAEGWLRFTAENPHDPNYAIEVGGEAVGGIGLILGQDIDRRAAEIGYWLSEKYWGQGIATEAVRALSEQSFTTYGICRIWVMCSRGIPVRCASWKKQGSSVKACCARPLPKTGKRLMSFYLRWYESKTAQRFINCPSPSIMPL